MVDLSILDSYDLSESLDSPYLFLGKPVPRVTSILSSMIHEDYITTWANNLGFKNKGYKVELQRAADIGTLAHAAIEYFLKTGKTNYFSTIPITDEEITNKAKSAFSAFLSYWDMLTSNTNVEILGSEMQLICKYFGGTCDALLRIDDKIYIYDFKTSNNVSYKYILQLAAYKYILENYVYIPVDGVCILQLSKFYSGYTEYLFNLSDQENKQLLDESQDFFFKLVMAYYDRIMMESRFKGVLPWNSNSSMKKYSV